MKQETRGKLVNAFYNATHHSKYITLSIAIGMIAVITGSVLADLHLNDNPPVTDAVKREQALKSYTPQDTAHLIASPYVSEKDLKHTLQNSSNALAFRDECRKEVRDSSLSDCMQEKDAKLQAQTNTWGMMGAGAFFGIELLASAFAGTARKLKGAYESENAAAQIMEMLTKKNEEQERQQQEKLRRDHARETLLNDILRDGVTQGVKANRLVLQRPQGAK